MTSESTIAERVAQMHATMAAEPPAEPIGAFAREQAELAAHAPRRGDVMGANTAVRRH
jgi:hypothetical protein